jgi:radical SAM superfamily enzyme YgiQ (UPF0313 family)
VIDDRYARRFFNPTFSTLDTSRGCPFTCSYCSVKNVMGRTMRSRGATAVVEWVRDAYDRHGIRNLLVVDDDFFRSPQWDAILSGIAVLRATRADLALVLQTDIEAAAYAIPTPGEVESTRHRRSRRFVDLAAAAGCFEVFMGFESFDPANLEHTQKFHNEDRQDRHLGTEQPAAARERVSARYRRVVDAWHGAGVGVHCGYIIGLPFDRPGCGKAAAHALSDIGVDIASFTSTSVTTPRRRPRRGRRWTTSPSADTGRRPGTHATCWRGPARCSGVIGALWRGFLGSGAIGGSPVERRNSHAKSAQQRRRPDAGNVSAEGPRRSLQLRPG